MSGSTVAGGETRSLTIWYQPGVGESDQLLADWPQIERLLRARRVGWTRIDCSAVWNATQARCLGIAHLPAVHDGRRYHYGYSGLAAFAEHYGLQSRPQAPPQTTPEHTLPPEQGPAHAPQSRQPSPEVAHTRELETAIKILQQDQARQDRDVEAAFTRFKELGDGWQTSIRGANDKLTQLEKTQNDRWEAVEAGLAGVGQTQQTIEQVGAAVEQLHGRVETLEVQTEQLASGSAANHELGPEPLPPLDRKPSTPEVLGKWAVFGANLAKIGLMVAAPEVSVPMVALSGAGWLFSRWRKRRQSAQQAQAGRSEVRSEESFPRLHQPQPQQPAKPGEYERTDTGFVRSAVGGKVPDRFADLATGPDAH